MEDQNTIWVDSLGNLLRGSEYIGFYDSVTGKCELMDGTEVSCPDVSQAAQQQKTIQSTQTYWWVLVIVFSLVVIFFAFWLNRKK